MIQAEAIYERGVLRPLAPLGLQEHALVSLSISAPQERFTPEGEAARQRGVLLAYLAKVESQPAIVSHDGLSNRDHDQLIYGK